MTAQTHPLVLPDWLVTTHQLDLSLNCSAGWRYVRGGDDAANPAERSFGGELTTRYGPDGMPVATTAVRMSHPDGTPSTALSAYSRERTRLKKSFPQVNWHWTDAPADIGHLWERVGIAVAGSPSSR